MIGIESGINLPVSHVDDDAFDNRQHYLSFHEFLGRKIPSEMTVTMY